MSKITKKFDSFNSGVISPRLLGNTSLSQYNNALSDGKNFIIGLYGFATARPGTKYIYGARANNIKSYLVPFKYDNETSYILEFTTNKIRFFKDQGVILSGTPYEVTTTYAVADLPYLRWAQAFDTIYLVCPGYKPKQLQRITDTNWTFGDVAFNEPAWLDENETTTTLTFSATTGTGVTCTASASLFSTTDVGRSIRFKAGEDDTDAILYDAPGASQIYFDIPFFPKTSSDVEVYRVETNGSRTALTFDAGALAADEWKITSNQVEIAAALTTGQKLLIQRKNTGSGKWGYATITAYTSATQVTVTIVNTLGGTNASTMWRLGAWSDTTGYPEVVAFYRQRLWFGNTNTKPNRLWASAIQDFLNFAPDNEFQKGELDDNTSIDITVDGIAKINWLSASNVLLLGGEGLKSIGKGGSVISPLSIAVLPEESTIVKNIDAINTKNETVFVDRQGKFVYAAGFSFQNDAYTTNQLNLLADNLFEVYQVEKIEFTQNPQPIIWSLRSDGNLIATTYNRDLNVTASVLQELGGTDVVIESIAAIPRGSESELWMVVKRTVNGGTVRYIEVLSPFFYQDTKADCIFFDSSLTYSGALTDTITGLTHLEGETVSVIGDGGVQTDKEVVSGEITLDREVEKATIGLNYDRYITTVPLDQNVRQTGAAKGSIQRAREVVVDFYETDGTYIKINDEEETEINFRPDVWTGGEANPLYTGIKTLNVINQHSKDLTVTLRQPYGLPCTVRSIAIKLDITEN